MNNITITKIYCAINMTINTTMDAFIKNIDL